MSYLHRLIKQGENQNLDFKFEISDPGKIARSFVAFANASGGTILVGVNDQREITGIRSEEEIYMANHAASRFCDPPVPYTTKEWNINGKKVLEITIPEGKDKPYASIGNKSEEKVFVRVADKNIVADEVFVKSWKKKNSNHDIQITFSDEEKLLLEYLQKMPSITQAKYSGISGLTDDEAVELLSDFVALDVIEMKYSGRELHFYLADKLKEQD